MRTGADIARRTATFKCAQVSCCNPDVLAHWQISQCRLPPCTVAPCSTYESVLRAVVRPATDWYLEFLEAPPCRKTSTTHAQTIILLTCICELCLVICVPTLKGVGVVAAEQNLQFTDECTSKHAVEATPACTQQEAHAR